MSVASPVTSRCPCCGSPMPAGVVPREEIVGRLETASEVYLAVVRRLAWRPGLLVSSMELADYVWRDDPNGGPLEAIGTIDDTIRYHRRKLRSLGWRIENCRARWRLEVAGAIHG